MIIGKKPVRFPGWTFHQSPPLPEQPPGLFFSLLPGLVEHFLVPLFRLWGRSWRLRIRGMHHLRKAQEHGGYIIATWHGNMFVSVYVLRDRACLGLVSPVYVGELIARWLRGLGFGLLRGSSVYNSMGGLRDSVRKLKAGKVVCTILDGPEGPYRQAKPGAVLMAAMSGKPILPIYSTGKTAFHLPTWDRHHLVLPFTRAEFRYGEPIFVPAKPTREEVEKQTRRLVKSLSRIEKDTNWSLSSETE